MNRNLIIAFIFVGIIVIITTLSTSNLGFHMTRQTVNSLPKAQLMMIQNEGEPYPPVQKGVTVQTVTATNSIIPRRLPLGPARACLYNSNTGQGTDIQARYDYPATMPSREFEIPPGEVVDIGVGETKTITVSVIPFVQWMPRGGAVKPTMQDFDTLYLWVSETEDYFYPQCYNLPEEHKVKAIRIPLI